MFLVTLTFLFLLHVAFNGGDQFIQKVGIELMGEPMPFLIGSGIRLCSVYILMGTLAAHFVEFLFMGVYNRKFPVTAYYFFWTMLYGFLFWSQFDRPFNKVKRN